MRQQLLSTATQGSAEAQYKVGLMYWEADGVEQNDDEALKWFKLAAEQKHAAALMRMGLMHELGRGTVKNDEEAKKYYQLAIAAGDTSANGRLNQMLAVNKAHECYTGCCGGCCSGSYIYSFKYTYQPYFYTQKNKDLDIQLSDDKVHYTVETTSYDSNGNYKDTDYSYESKLVSQTLKLRYNGPVNIGERLILERKLRTINEIRNDPEITTAATKQARAIYERNRWPYLKHFYAFWALEAIVGIIVLATLNHPQSTDPALEEKLSRYNAQANAGIIMLILGLLVLLQTFIYQSNKIHNLVYYFQSMLGFTKMNQLIAGHIREADDSLTKRLEMVQQSNSHQQPQSALFLASPLSSSHQPSSDAKPENKSSDTMITINTSQLDALIQQRIQAGMLANPNTTAVSQQPLTVAGAVPSYGTNG